MRKERFAVSVTEIEAGEWHCSLLRGVVLLSNSGGDFLVFEEMPIPSPRFASEAEAWIGAAYLAVSPKRDAPRSG